MNTELLIIGGGASGICAGIQAARMGIKTLIIEESSMVGGMFNAAGVTAFDGNKYAVGGGIFGEFRKKIEDHYGGPDNTFTGWISLTCFEPRVGQKALDELIASAGDNLTIWYNTKLVSIIKEANTIKGAIVEPQNSGDSEVSKFRSSEVPVYADITVEATEYGDVLYLAGLPFRFGRESTFESGEPSAPHDPDEIIQDLTYCAILKKDPDNIKIVPPSENYDPERFVNSTAEHSNSSDEVYLNHKLHNWESFISYATLPGDKYLLNWPFRSNDYPTTAEIYDDFEKRKWHLEKAKELTRDYIHYMQTKLGHPEWGIDESAYDTPDNFPPIPYVRESRRGIGNYYMREWDVVPDEYTLRPPLISDSIAVGDYFLDHHHSHLFKEPEERLIEELPANAPFQIPMDCLIPAGVNGLLLAEKSISVSHIVNGCTRLQPCVMLIGQAVGALAALSIKKERRPADISVMDVQDVLLEAGCQLFPYKDLWNTNPRFTKIQELAIAGFFVVKDDFSFSGEEPVTTQEIEAYLEAFEMDGDEVNEIILDHEGKPRYELFDTLYNLLKAGY
ncbi:FAD-dependent oxidoreductase [Ignavibacteriales bacterium]